MKDPVLSHASLAYHRDVGSLYSYEYVEAIDIPVNDCFLCTLPWVFLLVCRPRCEERGVGHSRFARLCL